MVDFCLTSGGSRVPSEENPGENDRHELYLMCDDLKAEISALKKKGVACSEVHKERWGSITRIKLPGGGQLGLYQPKHPTAINQKAT